MEMRANVFLIWLSVTMRAIALWILPRQDLYWERQD